MKFIKYIVIVITIILGYYLFFDNTSVATPLDDLNIIYPHDLEEISGVVKVRGEASNKYNKIYYRIDLEDWQLSNGVNKWNFILNTERLSKGMHVIYVKAEDKVKAIRVIVK